MVVDADNAGDVAVRQIFPAFFLRLGNGSEASGRGNIRDKAVCTSKSSIISDAVI
ncbi:MAG TPA: hypothetical protein VEB03_00825 [Candidatus Nanoarchaeia archaeon]|nr:hypothetical protein [Candidatus Nanoarchaeia archaeon]